MDAQSLHKHNTSSSTKQRLHARTEEKTEELPKDDKIFKNEESIKSELHKEEFDQDGDGVVDLMEELDSAEDAKMTADEATAELESQDEPAEEPEPEEPKAEDALPQATILTMTEEKKPTFNAFSSAHASAPLPQQNRQAPVEEAKPVKDNTNAIIMILLIAILLIAVAIFGVIVLGEYRRDHIPASQASTSSNEPTEENEQEDEEKTEKYDYNDIIGYWAPTQAKSCLKIEEQAYVSWYTVCDDQEEDYYAGKATITRGQDAIDLLNITKERAARMVGINVDSLIVDDVYVLAIAPDEYVLDGASTAKPKEIRILFVRTKATEAQAYDYNYGELYILQRVVTEHTDSD